MKFNKLLIGVLILSQCLMNFALAKSIGGDKARMTENQKNRVEKGLEILKANEAFKGFEQTERTRIEKALQRVSGNNGPTGIAKTLLESPKEGRNALLKLLESNEKPTETSKCIRFFSHLGNSRISENRKIFDKLVLLSEHLPLYISSGKTIGETVKGEVLDKLINGEKSVDSWAEFVDAVNNSQIRSQRRSSTMEDNDPLVIARALLGKRAEQLEECIL